MADIMRAVVCGVGFTCGVVWGAVAVRSLNEGTYPPTMLVLSAAGFSLAAWGGENIHG